VFDKGRRPGGRLATRTTELGEYDHGAQYFTARDPRFALRVQSWIEDGLVAEWKGRLISVDGDEHRPSSARTQRYVGVPGMNSIAAHLAADCEVRSPVQIRSLERKEGRWFLQHEASVEGPYELVVVAVPAPQALSLLESAPGLQSRASGVRMNGCWAVLVGFAAPLATDFDGAFVDSGPLSWVARNGSKPGRRSESWVLHASAAWTARHLESDSGQVTARLLKAFGDVACIDLPEPVELQAHRWRYSIPEETLPAAALFDDQLGVAVCGDWCGGPRVEGAFLSGSAAAGRVLGWMARGRAPVQQSLL
jgi:hypothetical protein